MNINELLGINIAVEDYNGVTTDKAVGDTEYRYVKETVLNIEKDFDLLRNLLSRHKDTNNFITSIEKSNKVNRKLVEELNVIYPELLTNKYRIEDFTVNETATGVTKVLEFLNSQLNFIDDDIYQLWIGKIYIVLNEFLKKVTESEALSKAKDDSKILKSNLDTISKNGKLVVFTEGVVYGISEYGITNLFIKGLVKNPIPFVDTNSYTCLVKDIKEHLEDSRFDGTLKAVVEKSELPNHANEYSLVSLAEDGINMITDISEEEFDNNTEPLVRMCVVSKLLEKDENVRNKIVRELLECDINKLLETWSWFYPTYYVFHLVYDLRKLTDLCKE